MAPNIHELKLKYGRLFRAISAQTKLPIYFRLLTKAEYDTYVRMTPDRNAINPAAEELLFQAAVVSPELHIIETTLMAGEYHAIAEAIALRSGFHELGPFAAEVKARRLDSLTMSEQIIGIIAKAFPIYKVSDLDNMNYQELARLLALSEAMLEFRLDIPGAEIEEPKPEQSPNNPNKVPGIMQPKPPDLAAMTAAEQDAIARQRNHAMEVLKQSRNKRIF